MTYERFEDIPVWQAAIALAERIFTLTADRAFTGQGDLANPLQRAVLSISNNVAEGFERGSTNELIAFLYYARGSAGEVRSILCLLDRMTRFAHLESEVGDPPPNPFPASPAAGPTPYKTPPFAVSDT